MPTRRTASLLTLTRAAEPHRDCRTNRAMSSVRGRVRFGEVVIAWKVSSRLWASRFAAGIGKADRCARPARTSIPGCYSGAHGLGRFGHVQAFKGTHRIGRPSVHVVDAGAEPIGRQGTGLAGHRQATTAAIAARSQRGSGGKEALSSKKSRLGDAEAGQFSGERESDVGRQAYRTYASKAAPIGTSPAALSTICLSRRLKLRDMVSPSALQALHLLPRARRRIRARSAALRCLPRYARQNLAGPARHSTRAGVPPRYGLLCGRADQSNGRHEGDYRFDEVESYQRTIRSH